MAYNEAKRRAKSGEEFGKGEVKGIAAPEAANNGATAASLIPMMTLGIPGSAVAATLMGAFQMHGLSSGPKLFEDHTVIVYTILIGCVIAQLVMLLQGKCLMRLFVKITHVPYELLTSGLMAVCCGGAFAISNRAFDVKVMLVMGMAGYLLQYFELPMTSLVLGLILGPTAEFYFRNSLSIGNGNWLIFFSETHLRWICHTVDRASVFTKKEKVGRLRNKLSVGQFPYYVVKSFGSKTDGRCRGIARPRERKVRASQGRMPDNVWRRRLQGQCNRNIPPALPVRVEWQCKRLPPGW